MSDLTAVVQDTWPPRILLTASGITDGHTILIYRVTAGESYPVRGADNVVVTGGALVVVDAEFSFEQTVAYVLIDNDTYTDSVPGQVVSLAGGKVALTDAITGLAAEVVILAAGTRDRVAPSTVFNIDGKNRVVSGKQGQYQTTYEYFVDSNAGSDAVRDLLTTATQSVMLQRVPDANAYPGMDDHLVVLSSQERRFSQDGTDPRRVWAVTVAQCDGWSQDLRARGFTYDDVADIYFSPLGYDDWFNDYPTYLAAAQGDYS